MKVCTLYHIKRPGMSLQEGYIGVTTQPLSRRFRLHKIAQSHAGRAVRAYPDAEMVPILRGDVDYCLEMEYALRPNRNMGWNISEGGKTLPKGAKSTEKLRATLLERNKTLSSRPEQRERLSRLHRGKTISAEHRAILSRAHKGRVISTETRAKMSKAMTGLPRKTYTCSHCGVTTIATNIVRFHNENCVPRPLRARTSK